MTVINGDHSQVKLVHLVFFAVHLVFILSLSFLPFIDLPNHLAEATIYKYYNTSDNVLSQYYQPIPWYFPNTFHSYFCMIFPSVEFGNKIFHILCIALLQLSIYTVVKALKGNPWYALLSLLFTYNYNMTFGFVGFAISIPTTIILFYAIVIDLRKNRVVDKIYIALLLILLYWMHAQTALFGLLLVGFMMLYAFRNALWQMVWRVAAVSAPVLALIIIWWTNKAETSDLEPEDSTLTFLKDYYSANYFQDFFSRFKLIAYDNFQLYEGITGIGVAVFLFLCLLIPLIYFRSWRIEYWRQTSSSNFIYAFILMFIGLGCYFLLPDKIPGQSPLYQRFCTILMISLVIFGSVVLQSVNSPKLKYFSLAILILYSGLWMEYFYTFNNQNKAFTKDLFSGISNTARMGGLIYDNQYRGRQVYIHYQNYFLIWNQGINTSKIIDYRFGVVRRVAPESVVPMYYEYIGNMSPEEKPKDLYADLEYILVRGQADTRDLHEDQFKLLKRADLWRIYSNRTPTPF